MEQRFLKLVVAILHHTAPFFKFTNHLYPKRIYCLGLRWSRYQAIAYNSKHLLSGWLIRSWKLVEQHQRTIREILRPRSTFKEVTAKMKEIRKSYSCSWYANTPWRLPPLAKWRIFHTTEEYVAWICIYKTYSSKMCVFGHLWWKSRSSTFQGSTRSIFEWIGECGGHYMLSILG